MTIAQQLKITDFPFEINDKNGRRTYFEDSNGDWFRYEYDSNGNQTYLERSSGYWYRSEFDSNGNRTYYEDSTGYWVRYEYDNGNGKRTYYGNSGGRREGTKRSVDPCADKTVEIDGKKYKLVAL